MRTLRNNKAQAFIEMAMMGTFVLFLFGTVVSYVQQFNDQQYARMEAFRRALNKACTMNDEDGGSVRYTLMQRRRLVDVSGGFRKKSPTTVSGSASVQWGVPSTDVTETPSASLVFRVNDDEIEKSEEEFIDDSHKRYDKDGNEQFPYWSLDTSYSVVSSESEFKEDAAKQESKTAITNLDDSSLKERVNTTIKYNIKIHKSSDSDNYEYMNTGGLDGLPEMVNVTQGLYRDSDGQYRYSSGALDASGNAQEVQRTRKWTTAF